MKRLSVLIALFFAFTAACGISVSFANETAPGRESARKVVEEKKHWNTTDHSRHKILQKDFKSGPEVTEACLACHTEASVQFHETIHWTWLDPRTTSEERMGKAGYTMNNFCISLLSNEPRCTSCHAGYGWKDNSFDFKDQSRVDCLVCHETTGTYKKYPAGSGNPVDKPTVFPENNVTFTPPDYAKIAQSVALPGRQNCGTCHFFGGGGDGVKHGDLDSSLYKPSKALDVHMGIDGMDFSCTRCHSTSLHHIAGRVYSTPASKGRESLIENDLTSKITCESCHTATPHMKNKKANDHTDKVACQSCHIPEFARVNPTKMGWDWSRAGVLKDGKPYEETGELGRAVYLSKKGEMVWAKNVKPQYFWYNGAIKNLTARDIIDPSEVVKVNEPLGDMKDPDSRIFPFKVHKGKQPYDKVHKTLLIPHLYAIDSDDVTAFWKYFDWGRALETGMSVAGLPYSGEYDFVETTYVYPTTHMVAPANDVVSCIECHKRNDGRLMHLAGFYMPGRDHNRLIDLSGWGILTLTLAGVFIHALIRIVASLNRRED